MTLREKFERSMQVKGLCTETILVNGRYTYIDPRTLALWLKYSETLRRERRGTV